MNAFIFPSPLSCTWRQAAQGIQLCFTAFAADGDDIGIHYPYRVKLLELDTKMEARLEARYVSVVSR